MAAFNFLTRHWTGDTERWAATEQFAHALLRPREQRIDEFNSP
jgi:hypothetical protein